MFHLYCPRCRAWTLLDVGRVRRVSRLADGVLVVELACYDGETLLTLTGANASGATSPGASAGRHDSGAPPSGGAEHAGVSSARWRTAAVHLVRLVRGRDRSRR